MGFWWNLYKKALPRDERELLRLIDYLRDEEGKAKDEEERKRHLKEAEEALAFLRFNDDEEKKDE